VARRGQRLRFAHHITGVGCVAQPTRHL
jgi:hypothetical protein